MPIMSKTFRSWYTKDDTIDTSGLAREVFVEAQAAFSSELSKDKRKLKWIMDSKHGNLNEVLASVLDARVHYEVQKGQSKVRQILVDLSEKIHYYGTIMDVLVQHHPEYTSLVWGAMKILFVGVVNHQTLVYRLSSGLCRVADVLPRAELFLQLFPTLQVKQAIVTMYAHILRFLIRALRWYQESKVMHIVHAITRPADLRYDDLLATISSLSRNLTELALASSHAEQRDMHASVQQQLVCQKDIQITVDQLMKLVLEMKDSMATEQVINASARIELRQRLSDIQVNQFLGHLSRTILLDPIKAFEASIIMRNIYRQKSSNNKAEFWLDPKFQAWNQCRDSSLIMISGTWKMRFHVRSFCTDSVAMLREAKIPVIWALKTINTEEATVDKVSTIDLFKYLISQAICINETIHTDAVLTPRLGSYFSARTEEEWASVLASMLQGIPLLYIILDVEVLDHPVEGSRKDFLPAMFLKMFSELSVRNIKTVVKVALVSYGSPLFRTSMSSEWQGLIVPVGAMRHGIASARFPCRRGGAAICEKTPNLGIQAARHQIRYRGKRPQRS
ncbi:hypothetical protein NPX13_g1895 [Xylaria arbuscula]|uniref:DUF7708 domain-containing protein n=1 Tax=Xylaria arbuscula TaxID=114810 RepID=A0A9W8NL83_9PEZI|nr:hypothetical protein NPX13_g1895 [Xylaria arbuscula]